MSMDRISWAKLGRLWGMPFAGSRQVKQQGGPTGGLETVVIDQSGKLPSIIQCVKAGEGGRVEVEQIPRLADLQHETVQAVEIANVPDPETGVTRWEGGGLALSYF